MCGPVEEIRRSKPSQSITFFVQSDKLRVEVAPLDGPERHPPVEVLAYLQKRKQRKQKYQYSHFYYWDKPL